MDNLESLVTKRVTQFGTAARKEKITYYCFYLFGMSCTMFTTVFSTIKASNDNTNIGYYITIASSVTIGSQFMISHLNLQDYTNFVNVQEQYAELQRQIQNPETKNNYEILLKDFNDLENSTLKLRTNLFF